MKRLLIGLMLLTLLLSGSALAQDKPGDCYSQCRVRSCHTGWLRRLHDDDVTTFYDKGKNPGNYWIEIEAPREKRLTALYLFWDEYMTGAEFYVQKEQDGEWLSIGTHGNGMKQEYLPLDNVFAVRMEVKKGRLSICELSVFCGGTLPDWVHIWRPTPEKADLLLLCAHPDDEYLFMGGLIPEYAGERQLAFVMAYLCKIGNIRTEELLNGLWTAGCRYYPLLLSYPHKIAQTLNSQYKAMGGREKALEGVWEMLQTYRPEVVVTHDVDGEYGQGGHKLAADLMLRIIRDGERPLDYPVKKLYLHLWEENPIRLDWKKPLASFGGKTALEVADEAWKCHRSQQNGKAPSRRGGTFYFKVADGGSLDNAAFGLAWTSVGADVAGDDLMENIPGFEQPASLR